MHQAFGVILSSTKYKEKKKAVSFYPLYFMCISGFLPSCVYAYHMCVVFTGDGVTDGCELSLSAEN